jgi:hypothetical protein
VQQGTSLIVIVIVIDQTSTLRARTEMVFETLDFSLLNHLTQLIAQENFINIKTVNHLALTSV